MNPIDRVIALSQIFMLAAWEAIGILAFGWPALTTAAIWFVGLWSFNILTATAIRTYYKMTTPTAKVVNNISVEDPEDFGG
jgi:hypothetical protein